MHFLFPVIFVLVDLRWIKLVAYFLPLQNCVQCTFFTNRPSLWSVSWTILSFYFWDLEDTSVSWAKIIHVWCNSSLVANESWKLNFEALLFDLAAISTTIRSWSSWTVSYSTFMPCCVLRFFFSVENARKNRRASTFALPVRLIMLCTTMPWEAEVLGAHSEKPYG